MILNPYYTPFKSVKHSRLNKYKYFILNQFETRCTNHAGTFWTTTPSISSSQSHLG